MGQESKFWGQGPITEQVEIKVEDGIVWVEDVLGDSAGLFKETVQKQLTSEKQ